MQPPCDPAALEAMFKGPPALHRYPGSMAERTQALREYLVDRYGGDHGRSVGRRRRRCRAAAAGPGAARLRCGQVQDLTAMLAKRFGVRPPGLQLATAPFSDDQPRSVADIDSPETLQRVRSWKKAMKAEGKTKSDVDGCIRSDRPIALPMRLGRRDALASHGSHRGAHPG